jgi:hypothetical protein
MPAIFQRASKRGRGGFSLKDCGNDEILGFLAPATIQLDKPSGRMRVEAELQNIEGEEM